MTFAAFELLMLNMIILPGLGGYLLGKLICWAWSPSK